MLNILYNTLLESAPYIILGLLIAGVLRFWVPENTLHRHLGQRSGKTLLKSVGIGCVLPMCSCGTIPLGIGLFKSGAAVGNVLAFMTSTPILSPILIALSFQLLGVKLTTTLVISSVIGALLMGKIGNNILHTRKNLKKEPSADISFTPEIKPSSDKEESKTKKTLKWAFLDLGADISVDILIGLGIASLLLAVLPLEWVSKWLGQQDLMTLIYVVILGIPVYACSIPSIVVVHGLLLLGATPGAAIAYMIAGPATNLGELNAIRKSMGKKTMLFYVSALLLISIGSGLITDQLVFPDYQYRAYQTHNEIVVRQCCVPLIFGDTPGASISASTTPAWHYPFGILLLGTIVIGIYKKLKYFFTNPCKACSWKGYGKDGICGSKCHVRRKYEFLRFH